jgi:hypothetical protein
MLPPPIPSKSLGNNSAVLQMAQSWPRREKAQHPPINSGPIIFTPGQLHQPLEIPGFSANGSKVNGYQDAHLMYDSMRNYFAQRAYATHNVELVVVKVTMKSLKPGNKHPSIVSVC